MKENKIKPVTSREYKWMAWKNGQGKTAEIAISPPNADFSKDPFLWRLSSAVIQESSSFSQFPGYLRLMTWVEGEKARLQVGKDILMLEPERVLSFSGSQEVSCELLGGSLTDLNLIYQEGKVQASMKWIELQGKPRSFQLEGESFIFGVSNLTQVSCFPGGAQGKIREKESIRLRGDQLVLLEPLHSRSQSVLVEIKVL